MSSIKITYAGFRPDPEWPHHAWTVTIGPEVFNYRTGIGHETPRAKRDRYKEVISWNPKPKDRQVVICPERDTWAHVPSADAILACLFSDAQAGTESFDEFCSNFGYSSDSLKALDTYRACMDTTARLGRALGASYSSEQTRIEELSL